MTLRINDNGVDRDMTAEEIAAYQLDADKLKQFELSLEADKAAKETAKAELLARLGITEDEAKLLLG